MNLLRWSLGASVAVILVGSLIGLVVLALDDDGVKTTTAQQTATPTATATSGVLDAGIQNPFANGSGDACRLDKVGTWSEGNNPHRIEVGGHGGQHLDFYPQYQPARIYAVSYIIDKIANPDGVPDIAWGYGSLWEGDTPECASFNWTTDATAYAEARLDSGHSGLVIDLRSNPPTVVANLRNLSQDDIMSLLAIHSAAMRKGESGFEIPIPQMAAAAPAQQPAQGSAAGSVNCDIGVKETREPVVGQGWVPTGEWRVVNFWTNEPGQDQQERKILLSPGNNAPLMGGGTSWSWPAACADAAKQAYDQSSLPPR